MATSWHPGRVGEGLVGAVGAVGGCAILYFIASSTPLSKREWIELPMVKRASLVCYWSCLLMVLFACISLFATRPDENLYQCHVVFWGDTYFYLVAKVTLYYFYLERVLLSYLLSDKHKRLIRITGATSFIATVTGFAIPLAITPHVEFHSDHHCLIGLPRSMVIASSILDGMLEINLTGLFLWPVLHATFPEARAVALRSALACTSTVLSTLSMFCLFIVSKNNVVNIWIVNGCWILILTMSAAAIFLITHPKSLSTTSISDVAVDSKNGDNQYPTTEISFANML